LLQIHPALPSTLPAQKKIKKKYSEIVRDQTQNFIFTEARMGGSTKNSRVHFLDKGE